MASRDLTTSRAEATGLAPEHNTGEGTVIYSITHYDHSPSSCYLYNYLVLIVTVHKQNVCALCSLHCVGTRCLKVHLHSQQVCSIVETLHHSSHQHPHASSASSSHAEPLCNPPPCSSVAREREHQMWDLDTSLVLAHTWDGKRVESRRSRSLRAGDPLQRREKMGKQRRGKKKKTK